MQRLQVTAPGGGEWEAFLLSIGQDAEGELYLLTSRRSGPSGETGTVLKLIPAP
jgi:hypothetical protein